MAHSSQLMMVPWFQCSRVQGECGEEGLVVRCLLLEIHRCSPRLFCVFRAFREKTSLQSVVCQNGLLIANGSKLTAYDGSMVSMFTSSRRMWGGGVGCSLLVAGNSSLQSMAFLRFPRIPREETPSQKIFHFAITIQTIIC